MTLFTEKEELRDGWFFGRTQHLLGGVNMALAPMQIAEEESPSISNMREFQGRLRVDTGYKALAGAVRGTPRASLTWTRQTGAKEFLLITNATLYKFVSSEWQYVPDGTSTTLTAGADAPDTALTVASIAGFSDGDFIGIALDDGTQHRTTVNGAPSGSTINIDDAMPGPAAIGNAVVKAKDLSGQDAIQVDFETVPSHDWVAFTNGVDPIQRYDGTTVEDVPNLPSSGNTTCRTLLLWNNYLLLGATTEGGTFYPTRVRWPDTGDPENWTTGNAGFEDLYKTPDQIISMRRLGPYAIVYKRGNIFRGHFVNTADQLFNFELVVSDHGILATQGVAVAEDEHYLIDDEAIHRYKGGYTVEPLSDKIFDDVFKAGTGRLNRTNEARCIAELVEALQEIWFVLPLGSATWPNVVYRYSIPRKSFIPREFAISLSGIGFGTPSTASTWADAEGTWATAQGSWESYGAAKTIPSVILCDPDGLATFEYDFASSDDGGTVITAHFTTKDFVSPHKRLRVDCVDAYLWGTGTITVEYSEDEGSTWGAYGTAVPTLAFGHYRTSKQINVDRVRFRFKVASGDRFGIEWYGMKFREEGHAT